MTILLALAAMAATVLTSTGAHAGGACGGGASGGDWPLYGHDLSNSRTQTATSIGTVQASALAPRFIFSSSAQGGSGNIDSTPTVANGCVYVATDGGDVYALNADTAAIVWHTKFSVSETRLGGTISGAVQIDNGRAYIAVSDAGHPFTVALDARTGEEQWRTIVDDLPGSFVGAAPVPFNGLVFQGFAGDEYASAARGGYVILDARTGAIRSKRYTIPDADFANGYWGGSIWSTPAVGANNYIYAGAGNPASHNKEHQYTDALVKIDGDPNRATFGQIVDVYKGNVEQYYPGLDRQPVCEANPDVTYGDAWSATCVQFDLDFGASPNLFTDSRGNTILGDLQKSGVYHAVYADGMEQAWTALVGTPCFACNAASPAVADGKVYAAGAEPGQVVALSQARGGYQWLSPLADVFHYQSVTAANGVVYVADLMGNLNAFDASNGVPLFKHNIGLDVGGSVGGVQSNGVSVARNTVYVAAAGYLLAFK